MSCNGRDYPFSRVIRVTEKTGGMQKLVEAKEMELFEKFDTGLIFTGTLL